MDFNHILYWKLLSGSHEFPGPDGGTCINEAAVIAAGFKYKQINTVYDCPPCFSRTIAAYALQLNDHMPDDIRQKLLMPFVTKLAGTADTIEIENHRMKYTVIQTVRRILPIVLRLHGLHKAAINCESVISNAADAYAAANAANAAANAADAYAAANAAYVAANAANAAYAADAAANAAYAADAAANAAYAADAAATAYRIWQEAALILDETIQLGKQADPIDISLIQSRMEAAKLLA